MLRGARPPASTDAPACVTSGTSVPQRAPIFGRYHDGDVACEGDGSTNVSTCRGFLEVVYAYDSTAVAYYRQWLPTAATDPPYAVLRRADAEGRPNGEASLLLDEVCMCMFTPAG